MRDSWIAHIIGGRDQDPCWDASQEAKDEATRQRQKKKAKNSRKHTFSDVNHTPSLPSSSSSNMSNIPPLLKRLKTSKSLTQTQLTVFKGIDVPFSSSQVILLEDQVLSASVAGGVSFRFWRLPETLKLLTMFCSAAPEVVPSRKTLANTVLD